MSTFLAIVVSLVLALTFVGLFVLVVRLMVRPSGNEPRLLQTADGGFTVAGKQVTCGRITWFSQEKPTGPEL